MSGYHQSESVWYPGQAWVKPGEIRSHENLKMLELPVSNTGDRPIQVGSHYHFFEVNRYLEFDRKAAYGMRLAIPAGTAVRFEPGQNHVVQLIDLGGERVVYGLNGLVNGYLDDPAVKERAFVRAKELGFKGA